MKEKYSREETGPVSHSPTDNIMVSLDSLLDTRFGLLFELHEKIANDIVECGRYHIRFRDNFGPITQDVFTSLYRNRNKYILDYALPTKLLKTILPSCLRSRDLMPNKGGKIQPILYINYYPYDLNDEEIRRLKIMFGSELSFNSDYIKFISKDNHELSSQWVNENAHMLFMYNGLEWLEYQTAHGRLDKNPLVGIILHTPFILHSSIPLSNLKNTAITEISNSFKTVIDINFVDSDYFCFQTNVKDPPESK